MTLLTINTQTISIFVALSMVLFSIIITFVIAPRLKKIKAKKILNHSGVEADAIILNITQTGHYINQLPEVKIQVQVQPDRGRNFITETLSFNETGTMQAGSKIRVKYNPDNTKEIQLAR